MMTETNCICKTAIKKAKTAFYNSYEKLTALA